MKHLFTLIITLLCVNAFSQNKRLIDYFYSENHILKEYEWKVGIKETVFFEVEDGIILSTNTKILVNDKTIRKYHNYYPYARSIVRKNKVKETIIKLPNQKWERKSKEGVHHYYSKLNTVKTEYKTYNDCISVNKWFVANDGNKDSYYTVSYYAYKIGLVKVETYRFNMEKRVENDDNTVDRQLIDNSAIFSFSSNNVDFTINEKRTIIVRKKDKSKLLLDNSNLRNYTLIDNIRYATIGKNVIIEIGFNDEYHGYIYNIHIVNTSKLTHWIFDETCANWNDFFFKDRKKLFYVCEYFCKEKKVINQLDFKNQTSKITNPLTCDFNTLKETKKDNIIKFKNVEKQ